MAVQLRRALHIIPTATVGALLLAACGGSSGTPVQVGTNPSPNSSSSPVGLSRCMRAHGLSNFPDPSNGSGGLGFRGVIRGVDGSLTVDGITFAGPKATAAEQACSRFLTPSGPPPQPTAAQKRKLVAMAQCMRTHGVPTFPDPSFSFSGGAKKASASAGMQAILQSPAGQRAIQTCGGGRGIAIAAP